MANKVTTMVLEVDLRCSCCYKKIKKILCKFPQIRDQVYDEKNNAVTIKVACCSPEKIRDKLCNKGGKTIKSIEIVEPSKPKPFEKSVEPEKRKEPEKPKKTKKCKEQEKPEELQKPKAPALEKPKEPEKHKTSVLVSVDNLPFYLHWPCCGPCSEGYSGGPCYHGYGRLPSSPPSRDGYGPYGCSCGCGGIRGCGCGCGGNRGCRCDCGGTRGCYVNTQYFCEENTSGCTIM